MKDIKVRIGPRTQGIVGLSVVGALAAAIAAQLPEIRRYLKVKAM